MSQNYAKATRPSDDELIALFQKDGNLAFEQIYPRYLKLISSIANKYLSFSDVYDINDFIQEGLVGLFSACKTYCADGGMTFKNYAMLCVENRFRSIVRKSTKKSVPPHQSIVSIDDNINTTEDLNASSMQETLESKDFIKTVVEKINSSLSPLESKVFNLYLSGLSYKEIALVLSISSKTVDNALYRIRKKITM